MSVWWANVRLEVKVDGEFYISDKSFERPVLVIDQKAYLFFKITSRLERAGYRIRDLSVAGLPRESVVRTDVLVPISDSDLRYQMGVLSENDKKGLYIYLKNQEPARVIGENTLRKY